MGHSSIFVSFLKLLGSIKNYTDHFKNEGYVPRKNDDVIGST